MGETVQEDTDKLQCASSDQIYLWSKRSKNRNNEIKSVRVLVYIMGVNRKNQAPPSLEFQICKEFQSNRLIKFDLCG